MRPSPIDITPAKATTLTAPPLRVRSAKISTVTVKNNGNTATVILDTAERPVLEGGILKKPYMLSNIHFHWGPTNEVGSEHSINGQKFSMEMHWVFTREQFGVLTKVMKDQPTDVAVVAIFLKAEADKTCPDLEPMLSVFNLIRQAGRESLIPWRNMMNMLHRIVKPRGYFLYHGSSTGPEGDKDTYWIVYPVPILVSHQQVEAFRTLQTPEGEPITRNFKDLEPHFDRWIMFCDSNDSDWKPAASCMLD